MMKKTMVFLLVLIGLSSFVSGTYSTDKTDYYYDGKYYIADLIQDSSPTTFNDTDIYHGLKWEDGGFTPYMGRIGAVYENGRDMKGGYSLNYSHSASEIMYKYNLHTSNATFTGKMGMTVQVTKTTDICCVLAAKFVTGDGKVSTCDASGNWETAPNDANCDLSTIPIVTDEDVTLVWNWTAGGATVTSYIGGEPCHQHTSIDGISGIQVQCDMTGNLEHWYIADVWMSIGERPEEAAPDTAPPYYNTTDYDGWGTNKTNTTFYYNITWKDDSNISHWILSDNQSTTWVNSTANTTWVHKIGTWYKATMSLLINATKGTVFNLIGYANDTSDNWNDTYWTATTGYGYGGFNMTITVLNTAPIVTINNPPDGRNNNTNLTVTFTPTDVDGDSLTCRLYLNNTINVTNTTIRNNTKNKITTISLNVDGEYLWYVNCTDGTDYTNTTKRTFTLDTTSPILTMFSPANESYHNSDFWINVSATDTNLWILNCTFFNSSTTIQSNESNTSTATYLDLNSSINISTLGDGTYYINFTASDSHTFGGLRNLTWSYSDGTISFYKHTNPNKKFEIDLGYYSNGEVKKLTTTQIQNYNVVKRILKESDRYNFGARFDLPNTDFIFGFRFPKYNALTLINKDIAHFTIYREYWIDFVLYLVINGEEHLQTTHLKSDSNYWYVYWNIDWGNYDLQVGDRITILTKSIGGLNIVEQQYEIYIDQTAPTFATNKTSASSTTYQSSTIQLNLTIQDNMSLDAFRLTHNDTSDGTWINASVIDTSGTSVAHIFNYTITNFSSGGTFGWKVWANDSASNVNISQIYTFVVYESPTVSGKGSSSGGSRSKCIRLGNPCTPNRCCGEFLGDTRCISGICKALRGKSCTVDADCIFPDACINNKCNHLPVSFEINLSKKPNRDYIGFIIGNIGNIEDINFTRIKDIILERFNNPIGWISLIVVFLIIIAVVNYLKNRR